MKSSSQRARGAAALAALAALLLSGNAGAVGDPNLAWYTLETEHFRVHYAKTYEPVATRVAALAETIHDRLKGPLGYAPRQYTEIVLNDDTDDANGSATALPYNTVRLFVTAPDDTSALGDYDDWYLALVTHEYTHILHTDDISGIPALVNAVIGKTLAPNQVQPRWILEGLAVVSETEHSSAGRLRSSLFDMFLRADVLDGNIAGLDQISSQAIRWPQGNLWYLYGSRFLGWITQVYGPETMRAVSVDYGSTLVPWQINRAIRRVTGRTYEELYEGFKDHVRRRYTEQSREVDARGRREGVRLTHHGSTVMYPRFVPAVARAQRGREELVYYRGDLDARAGIYRLPLAALRGGEAGGEELLARTSDIAPATFTPAGDLVFSSVVPWKNVYNRNDLFLLPRGETSPQGEESTRKALTVGLRAQAADVSPDGKRIVFTVNNHGTTFLEIADLGEGGAITGRRDLVPSARFEQAYTPRFSPDGAEVAYSAWTAGGYRDVRIVDVATGSFVEVTHDRALDMQPSFSSDGRTLYFCSDRNGILNVYALDRTTKKLAMVTNTDRGALQPAVSHDGKTLVYVGYTTEGYDLYAMALDPARFLEAPAAPTDRPDPPREPSGVKMSRHPYSPLPTVAPRTFSFTYKPGNFGPNVFTFNARGTDVVGFHSIGASVVVDPAAPAPQVTLDYTYGRLPVDLTVRGFHSYIPRSGYRVNDVNVNYIEVDDGITTGLSYPIYLPFSQHSIGLSYTAAAFKAVELPLGQSLDPYSVAPRNPPRGAVGIVHLGYAFSNAESSLLTAGPARGGAFSMGFDLADSPALGDYSLRAFEASATQYVTMPWLHHTLAVRAAGAIASGSYTRSGTYYVGGYDLANHNLLDTVTSGVFDGAFVIRGYPPRAYAGREYVLANAEYRVPIGVVDHGPSTLPVYLRRVDANFFLDYGGAFDSFDGHSFQFLHDGGLVYHPQLHAAVGGEVWTSMTFGYLLNVQLRLGYARGFSAAALPGGQWYFVASSAY